MNEKTIWGMKIQPKIFQKSKEADKLSEHPSPNASPSLRKTDASLATLSSSKVVAALAGAAAWLATEWLWPKLLGDTLGHGLYPSQLIRQAADIGGAAGLSLALLLTNEALLAAFARRAEGARAYVRPLALAALMPMLLAGYGYSVLGNSATPNSAASKPLRLAMIQANIVDYERQRQQFGAYETVHKILDTHFAMSYDAVVRQHADAVMWSETSYPTTFGHPKSAAGAELDQTIVDIVNSAGVPFIFGTYDRDAFGEYNAAAFLAPNTGLLGFYRKTRLFPFTEYVPAWLDSPLVRRLLPWTGNWQHGNGARVFPLRLADGREIPVLPLICRDDVDASLGIAGARLGAQAILTMSNDAWFSDYPQGAELHQAVAAFRSIETRLPQFRVTTNGFSGVIDANGNIQAASKMGQQTLIIGDIAARTPPRTLIVWWGDWVGLAGLAFLLSLLLQTLIASVSASAIWQRYLTRQNAKAQQAMALPLAVSVLPPAARIAASVLRSFARLSLIGIGIAMLQSDALRGNTLAQIRSFSVLFLVPEVAAWCVLLAFGARASIENGALVLTRGAHRIEIALVDIAAVEVWRLPLPSAGVSLRLSSGARWRYGLALTHPNALVQALQAAGITAQPAAPARGALYQQARLAIQRGRLDQPFAKFVLLPFLLAFPAYYLHQHIAYGSGFGEFTSFGLKAYLLGFALWWAAWAIGVMAFGAALRAMIELGTVLGVLLRPSSALELRRWLECAAKLALYVGVPGWLLLRVYGG
ncbi:MAG: apolipoprotein N-acyltransferase [Burkholderiales bacterium]|nr:apolipoprotein N-acyltransferase [Burkholderiales bacterium]